MTDERTINLLDGSLYVDPAETYRWLRDERPCYWDAVNGIWGISRYDDIVAVEKSPAMYSSASGSRPLIQSGDSMINKDDPLHQDQRRIVVREFTPRAVKQLDPYIRGIVTEIIDKVASAGECEVIQDIASPLPAMIICDKLGFDRSLWPKCREWSEVTMYEAGQYPLDGTVRPPSEGSMTAILEFAEACMELIAARRAEPRDDLISAWVHAEVDGKKLTDDEIVHEALLVLDGGAETTRAVIGTTCLTLIRHPEQRQILIDDPSIIGETGVEEFIRWVSPVLNMRRTVTTDHELHGQQLHAGDELLLMYPSANRDERVFTDPYRFDVRREHNHHVAFGFGTHFCLGANLARQEIRIMFEELLRRIPDMRLAPGADPKVVPAVFAQAHDAIPVEFTPE
ncbi:MAG: cytochrome P450 [Acidimicrobiales bacterium]|nr:cytochrome P450 [Acidimicrobiales bacterium]